MDKKSPLKLVELMSCAIALGAPIVTSGIVSADNVNEVQNTSYCVQNTKITFNPNDTLTKQVLSKTQQKGTIKKVTLITLKDGKISSINMDNKNGVYVATLQGDQKDTKYQFAVTYSDGKTIRLNNPYADNQLNSQFSVIGNDNSSAEDGNVTAINSDGTILEMKEISSTGSLSSSTSGSVSNKNSDSTRVSVISSSKINASSSSVNNTQKRSESSVNKQQSSSILLTSIIKSSNSENAKNSDQGNDNFFGKNNSNDDTGDKQQAAVTKKADNRNNGRNDENAGPTNNTNNTNSNSASDSSSSNSSSSSVSSSSSSVAGNDAEKSMPQTGEMILRGLSILGVAALACVGGYYGFQIYKKKNSK